MHLSADQSRDRNGQQWRFWCAAILLGALGWVGCGAEAVGRAEPNPLRQVLEQDVAKVDRSAPLQLRYNPARCQCPPFELRLGSRWVRAELLPTDERMLKWYRHLSAQPPENWPLPVLVRGRVEREVLRTISGDYAVRIDVTQWLEPALPDSEGRIPSPAP